MSEIYTLTPLAPAQAQKYADIHQMCFPSAPWDTSYFQRSLENPQFFGLGAFHLETQALLGFILCQRCLDEAEILTLAVTPAFHRQGIGRTLVAQTLSFYDALGVTALFLEVSVLNAPAQRLYQSLGFHEIARRKDYYHHNTPSPEDALILKFSYNK